MIPKKETIGNSIPSKTLKLSGDISAGLLQNLFSDMLSTGNFPDNMKLADITPVFKEKDPLKKENYRTVSALSAISKNFEKLMQKQNWKKVLDSKGFEGAVLMDLSKTFDTLITTF